ncbi:type II toxin-antitoxin system HicB family antitoxin [Methanoplanus endosymbiosus]|uniref:Type II toxin-antitoxin system HicB family antitoxin n=1 Tax=Methanoplanus endosymbiosus TaxID=33865 RepID=A0A9E7PRK4_9EURY|nr:type II toxin-antitoxin system HicB family antitoxin [Methanoplanus endosymbiosus]UUX93864.1 type II toxin-antitoxin system HicB family antitoxin [Methanoplanus endosymbiosus]
MQGCYAQGETYGEALINIEDAINHHLEDIIKSGQKIPKIDHISLNIMEISG